MPDFQWRDIGWLVVAISALGGLGLGFLRFRLSGDFARVGDMEALRGRVGHIEQRIESMPNHEDMRRLADRIAGVERGVAVVEARLGGMEALLTRVDKGVHMLIEDHINTAGSKT